MLFVKDEDDNYILVEKSKKCKHCENECIEDFDICFTCLQKYRIK